MFESKKRLDTLGCPCAAFDRFAALVEPAPRLDTRGEANTVFHCRNRVATGGKTIMKSPVPKHSITIAGHRTAVSLEGEFWNCLRENANRRGEAVAALVASIDKDRRRHSGNLSSAIRLFVLRDHQHRVRKRRAA